MGLTDVYTLREESACTHNSKAKAGCERPQPGATQGGCCFDGARNALLPICDVAHIVHGPISCTGTSWDTRGSRSSGSQLYRTGLTTALTDVELMMGTGEARLADAIDLAVSQFHPAAVFVYLTCVPAMSGADVDSVAIAATQRTGIPVIAVHCAGFYGKKNFGQRIAGDALLQHVIGTREPDLLPQASLRPGIRVHDINLIGEWNVGGEFWNVAPLFDELGIRILCTLSGDSCFRDVQTMHRSEANMVVCSKAMLNLASKLRERYATPYFEGSFYGITDTSNALRNIARLIGDSDLIARTERLITREEGNANDALATTRTLLQGKRALIFSGGFKSWSTVSAVQELGMQVVATGIEKSTEEDKARIVELIGDGANMLDDNDQQALLRTFSDLRADILLAGDRYIYPALKARIPFLDLDHVRDIGYAGYVGAVEFGSRIVNVLEHPVWSLARSTPPWKLPLNTPNTRAA
jgi:nitrogenase molybdenum-iron cofactor biosynthesis protein NifE